jgi:uncharacterized protein HemX
VSTHTLLGALALAAALAAAAALAIAVAVMRQNRTTTTELRHHRAAHKRTHGRADPDPEHHGTSPTVDRLARELARLAGELEQVVAFLGELGEWAEGAERRLPPTAAPDPGATALMPAADRPRPGTRA